MADVGLIDAYALAQPVARRSYRRLLAFVAAPTPDIASAEDALGDAFAAALCHIGRQTVFQRTRKPGY